MLFFKRLVAFAIDTSIIMTAVLGLSSVFLTLVSYESMVKNDVITTQGYLIMIAMTLLLWVTWTLYYILTMKRPSRIGQTFGKQLMNIKTISTKEDLVLSTSDIIKREFLVKLFLIGYFFWLIVPILFDIFYYFYKDSKMFYHDKVLKTNVVDNI